jgi:hypothetical protein
MNRRVSILLLTSLLMPIGVLEVHAQPLPVFVAIVDDPQPPPLKLEQHAAAIDAAQNRMFGIATDLRKQHGNRQQDWPPEAVDAVYAAENVYKMAMARRDYQPANTRLSLDTVLADFVTELGKGPDFLTKAFVRPTVAAAYWDVEIGSPAAFKTAAAVARNVLEGFVKGTALSAAR